MSMDTGSGLIKRPDDTNCIMYVVREWNCWQLTSEMGFMPIKYRNWAAKREEIDGKDRKEWAEVAEQKLVNMLLGPLSFHKQEFPIYYRQPIFSYYWTFHGELRIYTMLMAG